VDDRGGPAGGGGMGRPVLGLTGGRPPAPVGGAARPPGAPGDRRGAGSPDGGARAVGWRPLGRSARAHSDEVARRRARSREGPEAGRRSVGPLGVARSGGARRLGGAGARVGSRRWGAGRRRAGRWRAGRWLADLGRRPRARRGRGAERRLRVAGGCRTNGLGGLGRGPRARDSGGAASGVLGPVARVPGPAVGGAAVPERVPPRGPGPPETLAIGLAPDAVSLGILDTRGMALDPDPQRFAEVERLLVRQAELSSELRRHGFSSPLLIQSSLDPYCPRCLSSHTPR